MSQMQRIAEAISKAHGIGVAELKGPSRLQAISIARFELMWRLYAIRRADGSRAYSLPMIGRFLGGRDHTTILHGIRRWQAIRGPGADEQWSVEYADATASVDRLRSLLAVAQARVQALEVMA
jgi:chromosomal replication initiation ATPase DnaA